MVLGSLAVGGVAAGGAKMFTYNREGWLNDVQVNQARRYQKQQVRLSQAEMFREDIRDLANASVTRHNNYVLIATLILGMIGECFIEGPLPSGTAEFVQSAYLLCVGSALLYMVLSLRCAISALHLANTCQKDLLVTLVRLPVDEFVEEIDCAARVESAEAFEHQSWDAMFRMPGLSRMQPAAAAAPLAAAAAKAKPPPLPAAASDLLPRLTPVVADGTPMQHAEPGRSPSGAAGGGWPGDVQEEDGQAKKAELHLAVFHEREREWEVLGHLAYVLGALGMSSLLQAYGYFAASKYYAGYTWASWAVQLLLVLVDGMFAAAYMTELPCATIVAALLSLVGPMSCSLAIRSSQPQWIDVVSIPLCFFCHFVWNTLGFVQMLKIAHAAALAESESPEVPIDSFTEAACIRHEGAAANPNATRRSLTAVGKRKRRQLSRSFLGGGLVILVWFSTTCWALYHAVQGDGDDGAVESNVRRLLEGRPAAAAAARNPAAAPLPALRKVNATWPTPRFRPHAIACAGNRTCFVANDFLIFQFDPQTGRAPAAPVQCEMRVPILDIAAARNEDRSWPMVLASSPSGSFVADCLDGSSQPSPLGGGTEAQRLAARGGDELFTVHGGGRVLQQARGPAAGPGWRPEWPVATAAGGELAAVDLAQGSGSLVLFYAGGRLEVVDTDSGAVCGEWQLPVARSRVLSAAVLGPAAAVLLLGHAETRRGGGPAVSVHVADLAGALDSCALQGGTPGLGAPREAERLRRLRGGALPQSAKADSDDRDQV